MCNYSSYLHNEKSASDNGEPRMKWIEVSTLVNPLVGLKRYIKSDGDATSSAKKQERMSQLRVDSATTTKQSVSQDCL